VTRVGTGDLPTYLLLKIRLTLPLQKENNQPSLTKNQGTSFAARIIYSAQTAPCGFFTCALLLRLLWRQWQGGFGLPGAVGTGLQTLSFAATSVLQRNAA
jgi:hypothetical protein